VTQRPLLLLDLLLERACGAVLMISDTLRIAVLDALEHVESVNPPVE
jgi:hypothetical protein